MRGSTLPSLSQALEWSSDDGYGPVIARLVPLDCKPGRAACEAVLPEEQQAEKQVLVHGIDAFLFFFYAPRLTLSSRKKNLGKFFIFLCFWCACA